MKKKIQLKDIKITSFVTMTAEENHHIQGGESNNRACPTAYACPTQYPVCTLADCTHPYYCQ